MNLYVVERHHQLLGVWREHGMKGMHVTHVDHHCDMRGLLVDPEQQIAYRILDRREGLDVGNYLRHAIEEGIVTGVTWVHGIPGGRTYDVNNIKHVSDATAKPHLWWAKLTGKKPFSLDYELRTMKEWNGLREKTFLDIDWDTFAEMNFSHDEVDGRIEEFLSKDLSNPPAGICICYSPYHSLDSRQKFGEFVDQIATLFSVDQVITLPFQSNSQAAVPLREKLLPRAVYSFLQSIYFRIVLQLKQWEIQ